MKQILPHKVYSSYHWLYCGTQHKATHYQFCNHHTSVIIFRNNYSGTRRLFSSVDNIHLLSSINPHDGTDRTVSYQSYNIGDGVHTCSFTNLQTKGIKGKKFYNVTILL